MCDGGVELTTRTLSKRTGMAGGSSADQIKTGETTTGDNMAGKKKLWECEKHGNDRVANVQRN